MHTTGQKFFHSTQIILIGILKHFLPYNIDFLYEGSGQLF